MKTVPIEYLQSILTYDPKSGILTWKERDGDKYFNSRFSNKPAGGKVANGYLMLPMYANGKREMFYAHRIAFALHNGRFPDGEIDHINGVRTDNRIENLRECTRIQNAANTAFSNQSFRGTTRHRDGKWRAQISLNNKPIHLGVYETEAEAYAAFCGAATILRGDYALLTHSRD